MISYSGFISSTSSQVHKDKGLATLKSEYGQNISESKLQGDLSMI